MKTLLLFANAFPYGSWEPFLETEIPYLKDFDEVRIFSLSVRDDQRRTERKVDHPKATVHPIKFRSRLFYLFSAVRVLGDVEFYKELKSLAKAKRLTFGRLVQLFVFLSRCHHEASVTNKMISKEGLVSPGTEAVLYSYRLAYQPYLSELVSLQLPTAKSVRVARAHGADLYEDVAPNGYIPLRQRTLQSLDEIILISQHGLDYLSARQPQATGKMRISHLGSTDKGLGPPPESRDVLRVLTCSNVVPVKRLDRLCAAFRMLNDVRVEWTHFGDGPLLDDLKSCAARLPQNITAHFPGAVSNEQLLERYATIPYHVLVNVSESEGIPVSMMEAMSFGIPVIATNVGGVAEIVQSGVDGYLLAAGASARDIADSLRRLVMLSDTAYSEMRQKARSAWSRKFNADVNYRRFQEDLLAALGSH